MTPRPGLPLGRIAGAPVYLSPAWVLIAAVVMLTFGPQVRRLLPSLGAGAYLVALGYAVILAVSVLVHEAAHAMVGRAQGLPAEEVVLTLWGGHTQFRGLHTTPLGSVATALAGPASNLALAGLAWAALGLTEAAGLIDGRGVASLLLQMTVWANVLLAAFNALPGLPLDGGRMVESAVWAATGSRDRGTEAAGWSGRVLALAVPALAVGLPLLRGDAPDLLVAALALWVGLMLWQGAGRAVAVGRRRRLLDDLRQEGPPSPEQRPDAAPTDPTDSAAAHTARPCLPKEHRA
ncbi:site-2 protease family protein [Micrococcus sp.]|uniref:site-2 protease family protein n=1 Tax=Micrococcus sp. TaxID=1271 RepID=UPI002A917946|nr:site-2 protease family protein [Micrococcus sp.]MDY6055397.1 site-2 protease family protein [Micrococcus sp.]